MFNGKKEDFEEYIKDCEKHIEMIHNDIKNSLKDQEDCEIRIKNQDILKEQFEEELDKEVKRYEELKKALLKAEDLLNKLKKSYESNFSKQD